MGATQHVSQDTQQACFGPIKRMSAAVSTHHGHSFEKRTPLFMNESMTVHSHGVKFKGYTVRLSLRFLNSQLRF